VRCDKRKFCGLDLSKEGLGRSAGMLLVVAQRWSFADKEVSGHVKAR
jgi:hypothetical protein